MKGKFLQILLGTNLLYSVFLLSTGWQSNSSTQYVIITNKYEKYYYWDNQIKESIIYSSLDEAMNTLSQKGYRFEHKRYKGEIIVERRNNLDFTLEFEHITNGLTAKLPNYPYKERIEHYNRKINKVWQELGLKDF